MLVHGTLLYIRGCDGAALQSAEYPRTGTSGPAQNNYELLRIIGGPPGRLSCTASHAFTILNLRRRSVTAITVPILEQSNRALGLSWSRLQAASPPIQATAITVPQWGLRSFTASSICAPEVATSSTSRTGSPMVRTSSRRGRLRFSLGCDDPRNGLLAKA